MNVLLRPCLLNPTLNVFLVLSSQPRSRLPVLYWNCLASVRLPRGITLHAWNSCLAQGFHTNGYVPERRLSGWCPAAAIYFGFKTKHRFFSGVSDTSVPARGWDCPTANQPQQKNVLLTLHFFLDLGFQPNGLVPNFRCNCPAK